MASSTVKAPVVMIGFNRPFLSERTMGNVAKCRDAKDRDAYLFIDGPREGRKDDVEKTEETRRVADNIRNTSLPRLKIVKREKNLGCRGNIIASISEIVNKYGKVIIVEDDVLVSRTFLSYMDEALERYESDKRIWCINACQSPYLKLPKRLKTDVYLSPRNMCWGWGVWADRWNAVDFDMTDWPEYIKQPGNDLKVHLCGLGLEDGIWDQYKTKSSWDTQCTYHMIKHGLYAIEPRMTLTKNCGSGIDGTHALWANPILTKQKYYDFKPTLPDELSINAELLDEYRFICNAKPSRLRIWFRKLTGRYDFRDELRPGFLARIVRKIQSEIYATSLIPAHDESIGV